MSQSELKSRYEGKTNVELLLIATNYDGGYTNDAVEIATTELLSRYKHGLSLRQVWDEEMKRLSERAEKCSLCQNPEVVYAKEFFVCSTPTPDVARSGVWAVIGSFSGWSWLWEKQKCFQLQFRLCPECLAQHTHGRKVRISLQDYHMHPLLEFFRSLGYIYIHT